MAVALVYSPVQQFFDDNGLPLAGGLLYSYLAGTSTPSPLYTDPAGVTPHTNPVELDASGRIVMYGTVGLAYKLDLHDSNDVPVDVTHWPVDNVVLNPINTLALIAPPYTTVGGMHTYLDPGEAGTEVLPTSSLQWTQQIQQMLREMKRTTDWNISQITKKMRLSWRNLINWTATGITSNFSEIILPFDWVVGTNLNFQYFVAAASAANTAIMYYTYYIQRDGQPLSSPGNTAANFTPGDTNYHLRTHSLVAGGLTVTDGVTVEVTRLGDDAGDTNTGILSPQSVWLSYTAWA